MSLLNDFSQGGVAIDVSAADYTQARPFGVYVGVAGNVSFTPVDGTTITVAAQAGSVLPWAIRIVHMTGTTATGLVTVKFD